MHANMAAGLALVLHILGMPPSQDGFRVFPCPCVAVDRVLLFA